MNKPEFSKFFIAAIKRTAQNVSMQLTKKAKVVEKISKLQVELDLLNTSIEAFDAPIKANTGGYGVEDLVERVVNEKGQVKWELKYPDTIVPPTTEEPVVEDLEVVNTETTNNDFNL